MTSPYLDRLLLRLDVVLPQLLENIEEQFANERLEAGDLRRLCGRQIGTRLQHDSPE